MEILGNYGEMIRALGNGCIYPNSFLHESGSDVEVWQRMNRKLITDMLSYAPKHTPLDAVVEKKQVRDGVCYEYISYGQPFGPRTEGVFLYPENHTGMLPCVVALHDHGGFKFFGKEKLVEMDNEPAVLTGFKAESYEGESWASALAKRGYAVFVHDVFMWGSRRQDEKTTRAEFVGDAFKDIGGEDEYIRAYNNFSGNYETLIAKSLFLVGSSWPGIMLYEDMRAVDYVLTRPEINVDRIGCCGLSCGGLRTVFMAAMDERIKCSVCIGFMSVFAETAVENVHCHTWMFHLPGIAGFLDLPDIYSLHGKKPTMALYDRDDQLWSLEGQEKAHEKLKQIYSKMDAEDLYCGKFYPGPHKFDRAMQRDAFEFFDERL